MQNENKSDSFYYQEGLEWFSTQPQLGEKKQKKQNIFSKENLFTALRLFHLKHNHYLITGFHFLVSAANNRKLLDPKRKWK